MSRPIRVAWIAGEPTPYRAPQLEQLGARSEIDLVPIYAAGTFQQRGWSFDPGASAVVLKGPSLPLTRVLHHDYPLTPGIWPLLQRGDFDLVVVAGWSYMAAQLAIVWARSHRIPYLLASENHDLEPRPGWVQWTKRSILPHIVPQAAGYLVPGSLALEHVLRYGARRADAIVFPNTIDVERFSRRAAELRRERGKTRARLGIPDDAVAVLQVSRLIAFKGLDTLIDAVAAAAEQSRHRVHLVLAGDGPLRHELGAQARRRRLPITFTGFVEGDALVECYVAADVFTLLSRREVWGVVVNEALACGLPVVLSTRVGAAADLLRDGANGFGVPADDVRAAATAVGRLIADSALREQAGAASRALIRDWGYERGEEAFVELAERVVMAGRSRRRTSRAARR